MGGGKSSSWGGGGGGSAPPIQTADLISLRESRREEVDQMLTVLRDVNNQFGVQIDTEVGLFPSGSTTMGYYDPNTGNVGINNSYFNTQKMTTAYDRCVDQGFHPPRGNKSAIEAVASHESGHAINYLCAQKAGMTPEALANKVVGDSARKLGYRNSANMARKISGYAIENKKEAIAEAFADVYCNGNKAKKESRAIYDEMNSYL